MFFLNIRKACMDLLSDPQLTLMGRVFSIASSIRMAFRGHASKIITDHGPQEPKSGRQNIFKVCKCLRPRFNREIRIRQQI